MRNQLLKIAQKKFLSFYPRLGSKTLFSKKVEFLYIILGYERKWVELTPQGPQMRPKDEKKSQKILKTPWRHVKANFKPFLLLCFFPIFNSFRRYGYFLILDWFATLKVKKALLCKIYLSIIPIWDVFGMHLMVLKLKMNIIHWPMKKVS